MSIDTDVPAVLELSLEEADAALLEGLAAERQGGEDKTEEEAEVQSTERRPYVPWPGEERGFDVE